MELPFLSDFRTKHSWERAINTIFQFVLKMLNLIACWNVCHDALTAFIIIMCRHMPSWISKKVVSKISRLCCSLKFQEWKTWNISNILHFQWRFMKIQKHVYASKNRIDYSISGFSVLLNSYWEYFDNSGWILFKSLKIYKMKPFSNSAIWKLIRKISFLRCLPLLLARIAWVVNILFEW